MFAIENCGYYTRHLLRLILRLLLDLDATAATITNNSKNTVFSLLFYFVRALHFVFVFFLQQSNNPCGMEWHGMEKKSVRLGKDLILSLCKADSRSRRSIDSACMDVRM